MVKDAAEIGAAVASTGDASLGLDMDLEDVTSMRQSLIDLGEDIVGTPNHSEKIDLASLTNDNAVLPKAVPLPDVKPSLLESNSFAEMLSKAEKEELEIVKQQEKELLADKHESSTLLQEFETMDKTVDAFDKSLAHEKIDASSVPPIESFADLAAEAEREDAPIRTVEQIEAEVEAEMHQVAAERLAAEAEQTMKAFAETEAQTETQAETEADAESESEAESEASGEASGEAEDNAAFLELGTFLREEEMTLDAYLAKIDNPAPEQEILEPTFAEEDEAIESDNGQDVPMLSFVLTDEEFAAEVEHVAKQMNIN